MTFRRACSVVAAMAVAMLLSACFTVSKNAPTGTGPIADERLIGAWRGLDSGDGKEADAFLHFLKPDKDDPIKLVWVEDRNYQVYEVRTMQIGGKNVFAAKLLTPTAKGEGEFPDGFYLGFYEFKNESEAKFWLLDSQKIGKLIESGKLKGTKAPGKYDIATLTGSPAELARFLASADADAARIDEPATIRRLTRGK
jgi:hypothetical protein